MNVHHLQLFTQPLNDSSISLKVTTNSPKFLTFSQKHKHIDNFIRRIMSDRRLIRYRMEAHLMLFVITLIPSRQLQHKFRISVYVSANYLPFVRKNNDKSHHYCDFDSCLYPNQCNCYSGKSNHEDAFQNKNIHLHLTNKNYFEVSEVSATR